MPFAKLPYLQDQNKVSSSLRFLQNAFQLMQSPNFVLDLPLVSLTQAFQSSDLCDGAVVICMSQAELDEETVQANLITWLSNESLAVDQKSVADFIAFVGPRNHSSSKYLLAFNLNELTNRRDYWLLVWRKYTPFMVDEIEAFKIYLKRFIHHCKPQDTSTPYPVHQSSEEVLRVALDRVSQVVLICDRFGKIQNANQVAYTLLPALKVGDTLSNFFSLTVHPDDLDSVLSDWQQVREEISTREFDLRCRLQIECHYKPFRMSLYPHIDTALRPSWVLCMTPIEVEQTVQEAKAEAATKARFLAEMSHEIRTPLACIIGTSSLLSYTNMNSEQEELVHTIRTCSQQLFNLINNVLDISKIEQTRLVIDLQPLCLEFMLMEIVDVFGTELDGRQIDLITNIDPGIPQWILGDEQRLKQVLTNLISNAQKFTRQDSIIRIKVDVRSNFVQKDEQPMLCFAVSDEGEGIPRTVSQSHVFESFVQLENAQTRRGSGLGLTISKRLVNLMGGEIWYESEEGRGTTFLFTHPLKEASRGSGIVQQAKRSDILTHKEALAALQASIEAIKSSVQISIYSWVRKKGLCHYICKSILKGLQGVRIQCIDRRGEEETSNKEVVEELLHQSTGRRAVVLITDVLKPCDLSDLVYEHDAAFSAVFLSFEPFHPKPGSLCDSKMVACMRKPIKPALIVKSIHEVILPSLLRFSTSGMLAPMLGATSFKSSVNSSPLLITPNRSLSTPSKVPIISSQLDTPTKTDLLAIRFPLRIMLAEDNLMNQRLMTKILNKFGYEGVGIAENGSMALEMCKSEMSYDLILMDMQMPVKFALS